MVMSGLRLVTVKIFSNHDIADSFLAVVYLQNELNVNTTNRNGKPHNLLQSYSFMGSLEISVLLWNNKLINIYRSLLFQYYS